MTTYSLSPSLSDARAIIPACGDICHNSFWIDPAGINTWPCIVFGTVVHTTCENSSLHTYIGLVTIRSINVELCALPPYRPFTMYTATLRTVYYVHYHCIHCSLCTLPLYGLLTMYTATVRTVYYVHCHCIDCLLCILPLYRLFTMYTATSDHCVHWCSPDHTSSPLPIEPSLSIVP